MSQNTLWSNGSFTISTDKRYLDENVVFHYLHDESYWAKGIPRELVQKSIANSTFCFGIYTGNLAVEKAEQIGFARVISDLVTFAYLKDVFVLPSYRGQGLSKWLMQVIVEHPELKDVYRFMLGTADAHGLYAQYGFGPLQEPSRYMYRKNDRT